MYELSVFIFCVRGLFSLCYATVQTPCFPFCLVLLQIGFLWVHLQDRDTQIQAIEGSFEAAKKPVKIF